jgi:hypothetical protein
MGNSADSGGGIYNYGYSGSATLTLQNSTLDGNSASISGGGLYNASYSGGSATVTIQYGTFSGNSAKAWGGGLYSIHNSGVGLVTLENSTLSGNSAGDGGGTHASGATLSFRDCTLSGNLATNNGAAIYAHVGAALTLQNSTVSGHLAFGVTGIYSSSDAQLTMTHTLLARGGYETNFFWRASSVTNFGYNVSDDASTKTFASTVANLFLGPLNNNGGPTLTHALLPNSPAINAGDPDFAPPPDYDQRGAGFPRVAASRLDIGALESPLFSTTLLLDATTNHSQFGEAVTFTATVTVLAPGSGTPTGTVGFFDGGTRLGSASLSIGSASFSTAIMGVGAHSVSAVYFGDGTFAGSTSPSRTLQTDCVTNLTVVNTDDDGPGSLRQALAGVCPNGTIRFDPALSGQTVRLTSGQLTMSRSMSVLAPGADRLTIDGSGRSGVIYINPGVTGVLAGLTIANGNVLGEVPLLDEYFDASDGGFAVVKGIGANATLGLEGWTYAAAAGSWRANGGTGVKNCTLNTPTMELLQAGDLLLRFSHRYNFEDDGASRWDGGAVFVSVNGGPFTYVPTNAFLTNGYAMPRTIAGNSPPLKGLYAFSGTSVGFGSSQFLTSVAKLGRFLAGDRITVRFLAAWDEGFVQTPAPNWEITSVSLGTENKNGGGIYNDHAVLTVSNLTLSGNAAGRGGGIFNDGSSTGSATLTIFSSTLSGNSADDRGGGIYNSGDSGSAALTLQNCTLSGNSTSGEGGGVYNDGPSAAANLTLQHCTFCGNSAGLAGGGIFDFDGPLTVTHTLLAKGVAGENYFGLSNTAVTNLGYNLSDDSSTTDFAATVTNLLLGPLTDNGGPTLTHALLTGSPAINAGDPHFTGLLDFDQRGTGFPRIVGGRIDVGALELQTMVPLGPMLLNLTWDVAGGGFGFKFENGSGESFSVLATTNLALPLSNWTVLGDALEFTPGQYRFVDTQATNAPQRFYRVRSH